MDRLRRGGKDKFLVWAMLVVLLEFSISSRRVLGSGSCPFSKEASADDHHYHEDHVHEDRIEFLGLEDEEGHSHHGREHSDHHHHEHEHGDMEIGILSHEDGEGHSHSHSHHGCGHSDHHHHEHEHGHRESHIAKNFRLQEELEEEEDLRLYGFGSQYHDHYHEEHDHEHLSTTGLWLRAMGCSLLVSMASLVCLMILPLIVSQGKPSKTVVDLLAAFGAGAMVGDAFLHQLPHALGGSHNHSHSHSLDNGHDHTHNHNHNHNHNHASIDSHAHSHSHSFEELSVGLAALVGIILFFLVEKIVRYVEGLSSQGVQGFHYGHHHHHKSNVCSKKDDDHHDRGSVALDETETSEFDKANEENSLDENDDGINDVAEKKDSTVGMSLRKRNKSNGATEPEKELLNSLDASSEIVETSEVKSMPNSTSNLVVGYLNLFSDGVHNFTDGMALGSAFLLHGSVGGWSRTLFLLAHELPQERTEFFAVFVDLASSPPSLNSIPMICGDVKICV
ncbi:hypothetical protein KI387_016078 [Taxus chinensis]|uniref:IAA-alanine resistance protein 1 n=1 Tax=Taxus chinensis TaxID=29808 RepID=A0AA38LEA5_TAXCH|nr:hypothetical protein KI387_016078 [Taxus chinensis]